MDRERSINDTRMIYVYKSAEGSRISSELEKKIETMLKRSIDSVPELRDVLQTMNWNLEKEISN